ncbi:MAG TPA: APC family permease [Myxococcota bacterium]|nr:APC family permease [Myxococcota bacterium]
MPTGGDDVEDSVTESVTWDFPGWGTATLVEDLDPVPVQKQKHTRLGTLAATAICGNDITSSCLYVAALCAAQSGRYAPVALAMVAVLLYLFRKVYAEVGSALPLNGGTYTVLLNTTNKRLAAAAACLTLLSYVATAVISASEAMHYAHNLWHGLPVFYATIGLLGLFAFLNLVGISESAVVAVAIFLFHMTTLVLLSATGMWAVLEDPSTLWSNQAIEPEGGMGRALVFGFAAAMLGISGFESSANFIEEQERGVFTRTLRNMWLAVAVFNPLLSLLSLGLLPMAIICEVPPDLLARMGDISAGRWLGMWVSVDAVFVLSGAVLTSYVGVTGLVRRMALDRCLPQVLLAQNQLRGTNHWIILLFFFVCCSILAVTGGQVTLLAGVYTISFLSVMALFAVGNMLLKSTRGRLPREERATWPGVVTALLGVLVGLVGNVVMDPTSVRVFATYFAVTLAVVGVMFLRVDLLRIGLVVVDSLIHQLQRLNRALASVVREQIQQINSQSIIYFTKGDDAANLNKAALYVQQNEQTTRMVVVHVFEKQDDVPPKLAETLSTIDHLYPNLRIDFIAVKGKFGPELIEGLSRRFNVPRHYMFIGTPSDRFPHRIEELGGVRLVL